jgi:hypothetical protein
MLEEKVGEITRGYRRRLVLAGGKGRRKGKIRWWTVV